MFNIENNPSKSSKKQKRKAMVENELSVTGSMQGLEHPQYLQKVNYMALDSFEASLQDLVIHKTYHQAIMQNQHLFAQKVVLHITQGTNCLYSIFAAQSGSLKVYCAVNGESQAGLQNIYMMNQIIKENNLQNRIEVVSWNNFNAEVDIIIAEPMGYCLHFDGLIDRVIEARDLYLSKKGIIFPNILSFKCALIHDEHFSDHKINYWDDVYGVPMASMKKWISHEPVIRAVDPALIVSKVTKLLTFNLQTVTYQEVIKIDRVFEAEPLPPCKANGIAFWYQTFFQHCIEVKDIKASPWVQSTKYTQATLYWPNVLQLNSQKIRIRLKGQKHCKEGYSIVSTQVNNKVYQYSFS